MKPFQFVRRGPVRAHILLAALIALALTRPAPAAIETTGDNAHVTLPAPAFAFEGESNTIFLWLRRAPATGSRAILEIPGAVVLITNAAGDLAATLSGADHTFNLVVPAALPENEWSLVTLTVSHPAGDVALAAESVSGGFRSHGASRGAPFALGPVAGQLTLGAINERPAMRGVYGIVVVRDHAVSLSEARDLFANRHHFGPFDYLNLDTGGNMSGAGGALWMINHALFSQPFNGAGQSYSALQLASRPDFAARRSDFAVFDRSAALHPDKLRVIRPVSACDDFVYRSPFDVDPGFFLRDPAQTNEPLPPNPVAAVSPRARALVDHAPESGPPMRVIASANSRGVKAQDAFGAPGNFAHGFTLALRPKVAGIIMRPASTSDVGPYFGLFSTPAASHRVRRSPDCVPIEPTNFARFWTGSLTPNAVGPGLGARLTSPTSFYSLRARPEEGSLLKADARLTTRAYLLAYPGAPTVQVFADAGATQNEPGPQSLVDTVNLDTSIESLTTTVVATPTLSILDVAGDRADIQPGAAVALGEPFFLDISVVAAASYIPGQDITRLLLEHPLRSTPTPGTVARFGEHRVVVVEHTHGPAVAPHLWRGIEIRRDGQPALDAVLFAFDAFNPDEGGFVFGPAGWSGRGYDPQINESFDAALHHWIAAADADLWLQFIAHQHSDPVMMSQFTAVIRAASPDTEIGWIGCGEYEDTIHESWQRHILSNARQLGVVGLTILDHPLIGSFADMAADGGAIDGGHLTARGNLRVAQAALDVLGHAARWPGDANNDGIVTFADLNVVLANFGGAGPADGSLPGDLNFDGAVDFADLNAVLAAFGTSVFD